MIVILTSHPDPTVDRVEHIFRQRGVSYLRFNNSQFPVHAKTSLQYSNAGPPVGTFEVDGSRYDLAGISAIWERRPDVPVAPPQITRGLTQRFVSQECSRFIHDFWQTLDCRWLPAPTAVVKRVEDKILQTKVAHALGFDLPPALITNDPREFLEFYREHNGRIISKVFQKKLLRPEAPGEQQAYWLFTEIVAGRAAGYAASIRHSPVIFQAYVPKRSELRVTVVGRQVFAAEIFSQETHRTRRDWRRYDHGHTPYRPHQLPADLESRCVCLVERLGLSFGAIDLVLTPDGRYVFLEINPRGEWGWTEQLTGLPITAALCDYLTGSTCRAAPEGALQT